MEKQTTTIALADAKISEKVLTIARFNILRRKHMKRSEVNRLIKDAIEFMNEMKLLFIF